jgi:ubiquinone/menaquinone biosynthesis C-methylase UbiE
MNSLLSRIKISHILDVACGSGAAIQHIDSSNAYTGIDLSYSMLKQAAKKANNRSFESATFVQGNAEKLIFDDNSFDVVLFDTALHMIHNYRLAVSEAVRVLKTGGVMVVSTPVVGINKSFDQKWIKLADKRKLNVISEGIIKRICSDNTLIYSRYATNGGVLYFKAKKSNASL